MSQEEATIPQGIAIVGIAGRFPGADTVDQLWENLRGGVESIRFFSDDELTAAGVDPAALRDPSYVKATGAVDGIELFDPSFFGFTPREAELLDPQHRFLLEAAWEALEDAGYDPDRYEGRAAVFAGAGSGYYLISNLMANADLFQRVGPLQAILLNDRDFVATRLSYKLNLRGPSVLVQTACSTGLVAVHLGSQSLLAGESDLALAGGVSLNIPMVTGYVYEEGGISSSDGHCRSYDAKANGSVGGSGAAMLVLKRLGDALADGDHIYAVIRGSAVNNDGSAKVGFTAPSIEGQSEVITEALLMADVPADSIAMVEGHGSGTSLGDPIEVSALVQAFREAGAEGQGFCALGSIKSNIGHLNTAAGAAGLIKAALAVQHGEIPPSLHFEVPNPQAGFEGSPFYVPTTAVPWPEGFAPRRAGVSSFGLGGTNVHVVLEEAPETSETSENGASGPSRSSRPWQLLPLSARTETALETVTANLAARLEKSTASGEDLALADVAFTLHVGRKAFSRRRALVCRDREDAVKALRSLEPARVISGVHEGSERPVAFLFPGLGDHYPGMARELYETEPTFAAEVDRCAEALRSHLGTDIREVLFPPVGEGETAQAEGPGRQADLRALLRRSEGGTAGAEGPLARTELAQPILFVVEYALARLLMEWGIRPQAMIGYSIGEYVAACLAGVLPLDAALALVARRAKLIQSLPAGAMLAVPLPEAEVRPLLAEAGGNLSISATNGPHLTVVGGPVEAVAAFEKRLTDRNDLNVACLRLTTTHAFHSRMMEPAAGPLTELARTFSFQAPSVRYLSNVTGTWITGTDLADPAYWARHMAQPVRFAEGLAELLHEPDLILLEVGPGSTLGTLVRQHPESSSERVVVATMRRQSERGSDVAVLLEAAGRLWAAGAPLSAKGLFTHEERRRVRLPTYPFERQRCWIDPPSAAGKPATALQPAVAESRDLADWFYLPGWRRTVPPVRPVSLDGPWLVFADRSGLGGLGQRLVERLRRENVETVVVTMGAAGSGLVEQGPGLYALEAGNRQAHGQLVARLKETGTLPRRMVHLWTVDGAGESASFESAQAPGFLSLVFLAQALSEAGITDPLHVAAVSSGLQEVAEGEAVEPDKATILAALKVLPLEYPSWTCRSIDVVAPQSGSPEEERLAERLLAETQSPGPDFAVAWRGRERWARGYDRVHLEGALEGAGEESGIRLREEGIYLVTDGSGPLGLSIAEWLQKSLRARVGVLLPPTFPARSEWERLLAETPPPGQEATLTAVRRLTSLATSMASAGTELWLATADLTRKADLEAALSGLRERHGALHGVFHTASSAAGGIIQLKTVETLKADLAPSIEGGRLLTSLLAGGEADFLLLSSSTLAASGGFGQLESAALGSFLDLLAAARATRADVGRPLTLAAHWDPYQWDGWLAGGGPGAGALFSAEALEQNLATFGISGEQSGEALRRLLATELPRVFVASTDLETMIRQADLLTAATLMKEMEEARRNSPKHARQLATPYVAPRNELETEIAAAWEDLFGISPIGVEDSFLELGGHSLLAIQVTTELRKRYEVDLPVTAVFDTPTVAGLADSITRAREVAELELQELLAAVEGLSPEEALRRMEEEMGTHA